VSPRIRTGVSLSEIKWPAEEQWLEPSFEGDQRWWRDYIRWQSVPDASCGDCENAVADGDTTRRWNMQLEHRSGRWQSMSATRHSSCARYGGPCRQRKTSSESLNLIRCGARSQCSCLSVIWLHRIYIVKHHHYWNSHAICDHALLQTYCGLYVCLYVCLFQSWAVLKRLTDQDVQAPGNNAPLIWFLILALYIFVCLCCMLPRLSFFLQFFLTYLLPCLSVPLRMYPFRFWAGCRKWRLNLALGFCVYFVL